MNSSYYHRNISEADDNITDVPAGEGAPPIDYRILGFINIYKARVPYDMPVCILSIILNSLLLLIFIKYKKFIKQFIIHFSLIIGDVLNATGELGYHLDRLINGFDMTLIPNYQCFTSQPVILLILLGKQLATWSNLLIGIERMVAVVKPLWYKNNYRAKKQGMWATAIIWMAASLPLICMMIWGERGGPTKWAFSCHEGSAPWHHYPTYNFSTNLFSSIATIILTSVALHLSKKPTPNMTVSQKMSQVRLNKISLVLAIKMIIFVAVPNVVYTVAMLLPREILMRALAVITWFSIVYTANGALNFPAFWFINMDLRKAMHNFFCGDPNQVCKIGPATATAGGLSQTRRSGQP